MSHENMNHHNNNGDNNVDDVWLGIGLGTSNCAIAVWDRRTSEAQLLSLSGGTKKKNRNSCHPLPRCFSQNGWWWDRKVSHSWNKLGSDPSLPLHLLILHPHDPHPTKMTTRTPTFSPRQ
eukprot:scaffold69792_cov27-Attheya_sp.AAC.1